MSFLDFDDSYTKKCLVAGISATDFKSEDGKVFDYSNVNVWTELNDKGLGGTLTVLKWGDSKNVEKEKLAGHAYPAICELKISKSAKSLGKSDEVIVDLKYLAKAKIAFDDLPVVKK